MGGQRSTLPPGPKEAGDTVPHAAWVSGAQADAVVAVNAAEHARRVAAGLGAVPDHDKLSALMCLPLHAAVPVADLGDVVRRQLGRAPVGCVEWLDDDGAPTLDWVGDACAPAWVRRRFVPAASVPMVVVRGATWRPALRRAAAFYPFAARVVLLARPPRRLADIAWEADVDGTGLWITHRTGAGDRAVEEVVAPAPYVERYVKPAGWRFAERAYAAWLTHS